MNDIRIGLIGCGGISGKHLPELNSSKGAVIWALCDIDEGRLKSAGERYNVPEEPGLPSGWTERNFGHFESERGDQTADRVRCQGSEVSAFTA